MQRPLLKSLLPALAKSLVEPRDFGAAGGVAEPLTRDGPQNVLMPSCPEHLPQVASGIPVPDYFFTCQESSGNLVDICNSPGGVLTAGPNVSYQQAITGWTRKFVRVTAQAAGSGFLATLGQLWNIGNQSIFAFQLSAVVQSDGPTRCLSLFGGSTLNVHIQAPTAGQLACFCGGSTAGTFVYENATPTAYPIVYTYDRRGSGLARLNTDKEQVTGTWANFTDGAKGFGAPSGIVSPVAMHGIWIVWVGTDAETMADRGGAGLGGRQFVADLGFAMSY